MPIRNPPSNDCLSLANISHSNISHIPSDAIYCSLQLKLSRHIIQSPHYNQWKIPYNRLLFRSNEWVCNFLHALLRRYQRYLCPPHNNQTKFSLLIRNFLRILGICFWKIYKEEHPKWAVPFRIQMYIEYTIRIKYRELAAGCRDLHENSMYGYQNTTLSL